MNVRMIFCFFILLMPIHLYPVKSIFDDIVWHLEQTSGNVQLFIGKKSSDNKIYFYKAVTVVSEIKSRRLFENLIDFPNYPKIFPRTITFRISEQTSGNKFTIYSQVNMFPLKNRDYYIDLEYRVNNTEENKFEYIVEWKPSENKNKPININCLRINIVYGRWIVREIGDDKIQISVEYHNDFIVNILPLVLSNIEKKSTINALMNLIEYTKKN